MKLKTLKELNLFLCGRGVGKTTLEPLQNRGHVRYKDLKQEAIKWIKELEKNESKFSLSVPGSWGESEGDRANDNVIDWIKHFFGISEEDLGVDEGCTCHAESVEECCCRNF